MCENVLLGTHCVPATVLWAGGCCGKTVDRALFSGVYIGQRWPAEPGTPSSKQVGDQGP